MGSSTPRSRRPRDLLASISAVVRRQRRSGRPIPERSGASGTTQGVNVLGYFHASSGLGERARELVEVLRSAGVPVGEWAVDAPLSPIAADATAGDGVPAIRYDTTIAVVTAAELPRLPGAYRHVLEDVRLLVGYWFWEIEAVPASHRAAIGLVDEIWAPTRFVRDAYRVATNKPVRLVPLPIPEPVPDMGERADFGLDADTFTFLVSFDHLSVMERKNPLGAIEAFRRAFPLGDEPVALLVKTINGDRRSDASARIAAAAGSEPRVRIWDQHLSHERHLGLIAAADAYVSLHRGEGLGLHVADAMWLGTPVIATRYSGTLDLMDDDSASLIDARLVSVRDGDGAYSEQAWWADPDLDQAAAAMRQLAAEPGWAAALANAARTRMETRPDRTSAGVEIRRLIFGRPPVG